LNPLTNGWDWRLFIILLLYLRIFLLRASWEYFPILLPSSSLFASSSELLLVQVFKVIFGDFEFDDLLNSDLRFWEPYWFWCSVWHSVLLFWWSNAVNFHALLFDLDLVLHDEWVELDVLVDLRVIEEEFVEAYLLDGNMKHCIFVFWLRSKELHSQQQSLWILFLHYLLVGQLLQLANLLWSDVGEDSLTAQRRVLRRHEVGELLRKNGWLSWERHLESLRRLEGNSLRGLEWGTLKLSVFKGGGGNDF
jgi:hypothetical protein